MNLPVALPGTDLHVSRIGFGTAFLGVNQSESEAIALLDSYLDHGGNFVDTARIYSDWVPGEAGRAERILGEWLRTRPHLREKLILSTKGLHHPLDHPATSRVTAAAARADLEASLRALRTDVIDLYWLHRDDPRRPAEEILGFMQPLVREGKVRHLGASNWSAPRLLAANRHATAHGLAPLVANQPLFHVGCWSLPALPDPTLERMTPSTHAYHTTSQLPLFAYSPQAQGYFTRLVAGCERPAEVCRTPANLQLGPVLAELAARHNTSVNAIVLAYVLQQPFPTHAIIGPNRQDQLTDSLDALRVNLSAAELTRINRVNGFES